MSPTTGPPDEPADQSLAPGPAQHSGRGPGRLLVAVYGLLALAATGRSILQIVEYFDRAPLSYVLSALAAATQLAGILVERWLFFAEAQHTVTLYYRA